MSGGVALSQTILVCIQPANKKALFKHLLHFLVLRLALPKHAILYLLKNPRCRNTCRICVFVEIDLFVGGTHGITHFDVMYSKDILIYKK